ncbi:MAG: hypothetical protein M1829_003958 [Trizodia sp. TS-e1964]|nr:MAG: hypothetical protein M1829_003958 [Trizodia sp. TS-e1964]
MPKLWPPGEYKERPGSPLTFLSSSKRKSAERALPSNPLTMLYLLVSSVDAIFFSFFAVAFVTTVLRVLSRNYISAKLGLDDYYVILSVIFMFVFACILHGEFSADDRIYYSLITRPVEEQDTLIDSELRAFSDSYRHQIFDNVTQIISVSLAKLSLLAFYRRIVSTVRKHMMVLYALEAIVIMATIAQAIPILFSTRPISCPYNYYDHIDDCEFIVDSYHLVMAGSAINIFIDLCCVGLPWFLIPKLQMSLKLIAMYSLGVINITCSAFRIPALNLEGLSWHDWLESQFAFSMWSIAECFSAIVCVNVPGIFAAITRFRRHNKPEFVGSSSGLSTIRRRYFGKSSKGGSSGLTTTKSEADAGHSSSHEDDKNGITPTQEFAASDLESGNGSQMESAEKPS